MKTDTRDKIIAYIAHHGQARVQDLYASLSLSKVTVHRQLKRLLQDGVIVRVGKPPLVFYTLPVQVAASRPVQTDQLPTQIKHIIDTNFLSITPDGKLLYGVSGFTYWAQNYQKAKPILEVANAYVETIETQRNLFTPDGWIDATSKLIATFKETPITHLLFQDIYSYQVFGRTKLTKLVMYAKQIGDRKLIEQISLIAKPIVGKIIKKFAIEAVAFIPPTVPRPIQFMDELASRLGLQLPEISLVKVVPGDIPIPQKTLTSLAERVVNARDSIYLKNNIDLGYKNVLLIDDVVGSGASFQETAKKLSNSNLGKQNMIAFGLVGNLKGYDVIREI